MGCTLTKAILGHRRQGLAKQDGGNSDSPIDLVSLALLLGATFVARGFSGDKPQLVRSEGCHRAQGLGGARRDFALRAIQQQSDHKSYDFVREHNDAVNRIDFIVPKGEITVDYAPGTVETVRQHDGSI